MSNVEKEILEIKPLTVLIITMVLAAIILVVFFLLPKDDVKNVIEDKATEQIQEPGINEIEVQIDLENAVYLGNLATAKYAIIEFSDFQCPYCGNHANNTFPLLEEAYIGDDVIYVFNDMPIYPPNSLKLSMAGLCILENAGMDEFMSYRKLAYDITVEDDDSIFEVFGDLNIDENSVKECFEEERYSEKLENNLSLGNEAGIRAVPGFVVGKLSQDGNVEGYIIPGAYPFSQFEEILEGFN